MTTIAGIGLALVLGAIFVVPIVLGSVGVREVGRAERLLRAARLGALPAGLALAVALALPAGPLAAGLALPWLVVGLACAAAAIIREAGIGLRLQPEVRHAESAGLVFFAAAPVFAIADRLGIRPLEIDPLIVRLTAIHFTFAGLLLPVVGAFAWRIRPGRILEIAVGALVVGIPVTALGFLNHPSLNWIGALLVAGGGFGVGLGVLLAAGSLSTPASRALLRVAGVTLLTTMPLAAIYASSVFSGSTVLDIPTMARVHGTLNALGFALPAVVAMNLEARRTAAFRGRTAAARQERAVAAMGGRR